MYFRAVHCWGRESAQHRTTSYGLRYRLPTPVETAQRSNPTSQNLYPPKISHESTESRDQGSGFGEICGQGWAVCE